MTDFATLALQTDTRGLLDGQRELRNLQSVGSSVEQAMGRVTARIGSGWTRLASLARSATGAIAAAFSFRALTQVADGWSDMQSTVGAAIGEMARAPAVMQEMVRLANLSYSSLEQTVTGFTRNAQALRAMGLATSQQIDFTEALNHSLVITATRGERAASVQNALSVAMATGRLQGDGMNTVLANGGRVAQALADHLGVTVNELRRLASSGRITGQVIASALLGSLEAVRAEAAEMPATISDGFTRIRTNFTALIGTLDQTTGASGRVAAALLAIGDNIQFIASMAGAAGVALLAAYTPAIYAATVATGAWISSLVTLRNVLMTLGIGAFIVAAGYLINMLITLVRNTGGWGNALSLLGDVAHGVWSGIKQSAASIAPALAAVWDLVEAAFMTMLHGISSRWGAFLGALGAGMTMIGEHAPGIMGAVAQGIGAASTAISEEVETFGTRAEAALERAAANGARASVVLTGGFATAREALAQLNGVLTETQGEAADTDAALAAIASAGAGGTPNAFAQALTTMRADLRELRLVAEEYGAVAAAGAQIVNASAYAQKRVELLNAAMAAGIPITQALRERIHGLALEYATASQSADEARERLDQIETSAQRGAERIVGLFGQMAEGGDAARQAAIRLIAELLRMRAIEGLSGIAKGGGGGWLGAIVRAFGFASGGVVQSASLSAYSNGVYSTPQVFAFANGGVPRTGVFGEAEPEAIMPLKRGRDGKLGVAAEGGQGGGGRLDIGFDRSMGAFVATLRDDTGRIVKQEIQRAAPGIVGQSVAATRESFAEWRP